MRREALAVLLVLLSLVLLGLFGWLTRHPEAAFFARAERAPAIGGVVADLRRRYLDQAPPASPRRRPRERALAPLELPAPVPDREWIGVGATLRTAPSAAGAVLGRTRELWSYEVLERRGTWARLRTFEGGDGWVDLSAPRDPTPPLGDAPLPPGPLFARAPDPVRLQAALGLLAGAPRLVEIGGYRVYHDLEPGAWQRFAPYVRAALEDIEPLYAERYRLEPIGSPAEAVVLFHAEASYREFQAALPELGAAPTTGHAAAGVVALFAGARPPLEVGATLAHEVGHLLSRRALGPALPPWLDEGLAEDFATEVSARHAGGDPWSAWRTATPGRVEYGGPLAALATLVQRLAAGALVPLDTLVAMEREAFYADTERERLYSQSAFFVRCLLERGSQQRPGPEGFRSYLGAIRAGGPVGGAALLESVAASWPALELGFRACLLHEGSRAGLAEFSAR